MSKEALKRGFDAQDKSVLAGIAVYFLAITATAIFMDGTCDSGDSIKHFLFSKYAFKHPQNFLDHWAKPLFVIVTCPFAQAGFIGIKLFNCLAAMLAVWFTYKTAKKINCQNAWLAAVFLAFAPGYYIHIFSGLTEPLFSLMTILGVCLLLNGRLLSAIIVISFLPFVRSEGVIIMGVFACYLMVNKKSVFLPALLIGHAVYSFAGVFYYHDLLWVFNKIPYAASSGKYGHGRLDHFIIQLTYIVGVPLYALLSLGFVKKMTGIFSKKEAHPAIFPLKGAETLLIYGSFLSILAAHSIFWYFGVFESMGLKRVLVSIVPLAAIIALNGFNFAAGLLKKLKPVQYIAAAAILIYVIIFPFVRNPAAVNWQKDLSVSADQKLITDAIKYLQQKGAGNNTVLYYTHSYISLIMNRDPFDKNLNHELQFLSSEKRPAHYAVVWDNWFSVIENGLTLEQLKADSKLKQLKIFQTFDNGRELQAVVFEGTN